MRMAFVPFLVLLFAPVAVLGQGTLFLDNFDDPGLAMWSDQGGTPVGPVLVNYVSFTAKDGYAFLNLSGMVPNDPGGTPWRAKRYSTQYFLYAGVEMRLRLSSDNKADSDLGGGNRRWGFRSGATDSSLTFRSTEQGILAAMDYWYPGNPGDELLGFQASSKLDDEFCFWQNIEGIDLTEWHIYTILWKPEAATFLIDGLVVAMTDDVPQKPMRAYLGVAAGQNLTLPCRTVGQEEICTDEYIQVDYVRVFTSDEEFQVMDSEISGLLTRAHSLITELGQKGENTTNLRAEYAEAQDNWREDRHLYDEAKPRLERIIEAMENWDEIQDMFFQARECIETLKADGNTRDATITEAWYSNAVSTWDEYEYAATRSVLSNIIAKCPEPMLLTILGLILLPALLRRRN